MIPGNKASFYTLGCKLNFSETSAIAKDLEEAGFARVEFEETPDLFVINTCSVTDNADKKCRNIIRKAKRINPESFVVVIGCYAQLKPKEISEIEGVNLVLGANEKFNIPDHLQKTSPEVRNEYISSRIGEVRDFVPSFSGGDRTRTFLKIQDGCDYFCAFCTIPLARGKSRNADVASTLVQAQEAIDSGAKEIVLTGVNIGDFGQGKGDSFFDLIKALDELEGVERFRISSIEPNLLSNDIIEFVARSKKFMPHFHIPLQSGNDELLQKMKRKYDRKLYTSRVEKIKALMPHAAIGVDVIVGFPGESEDHFLDTYNYLNELPVSYLHVFTYSERANTVAIKMEESVPWNVRTERSKQLRILSQKKKAAFYRQFEDTDQKVLFEHEEEDGYRFGFSENYIKVRVKADLVKGNQSHPVKIGKAHGAEFTEALIHEMSL